MNVPRGMVVPSENVKSFTATRDSTTKKIFKFSSKIYEGEAPGLQQFHLRFEIGFNR